MIPKFRAFCIHHKCIEEVYQITYLGGNDIKVEAECLSGYVGKDFILMQSTGLHDKNGAEVFVGDIVKCSSGCPHEVIFKLDHGGNVLGGMPTYYLSGLNEGYQWIESEEVIGNVYENRELLGK